MPWWAVSIIGLLIIIYINIQNNEIYKRIYDQLSEGVEITLKVSLFSYGGALVLGAILGMIRSTEPKPAFGIISGVFSLLHLVLYHVATIFVEVMRGLPILVVLLVGAFILTPEIRIYIQD